MGQGEDEAKMNEIKLSEPTLYSLHYGQIDGLRRPAVASADGEGVPPGGQGVGVPDNALMRGFINEDLMMMAPGEGGLGQGEGGLDMMERQGDDGMMGWGEGAAGGGGGGGVPLFNVRASWLAGRPVWGDALVSLSRMTPTEVGDGRSHGLHNPGGSGG